MKNIMMFILYLFLIIIGIVCTVFSGRYVGWKIILKDAVVKNGICYKINHYIDFVCVGDNQRIYTICVEINYNEYKLFEVPNIMDPNCVSFCTSCIGKEKAKKLEIDKVNEFKNILKGMK